jgi:hypothetical protein
MIEVSIPTIRLSLAILAETTGGGRAIEHL